MINKKIFKRVFSKYCFMINIKIVTAILFIVSCNVNDKNDKELIDDDGVIVSVHEASKEEHRSQLMFTGTVKPYREANLGSAIPGRIENILYPEGSYVSKNDLVVRLSGEATAMSRYEYETLKKDYERVARLRESESTTQQEYDHIKAKYKAAEAQYLFFKNNSEIRAPFSGVIVEHLVNEGETFSFSPGLEIGYSHTSGIIRLMQLDPVKVVIDVNENLIPGLNKNIRPEITTDVYPDEVFQGKISFIKPVLSKSSRTAEVEIIVDNDKNMLMPGMYSRVNIELGVDSLFFLPRHAVLERENSRGYVWLIKNEIAEKKTVSVIDEVEGKIAVKGLKEGDYVAISGLHALEENTKVRVKNIVK